jgi:hypothetical protein
MLAAMAATLAVAPPADAGTARIDGGVLRFEAAPGERNGVILEVSAGAITVADTIEEAIDAGAGCTQTALDVTCPLTGVDAIVLDLADEDDAVAAFGVSLPMQVNGGAGDDLLAGGAGADTLRGGEGYDIADYSFRDAPVSLTLDAMPNDGAAGEGDAIEYDVEGLRGGEGDDTLVGGPGDDLLDGGPGADVLRGGDGLDIVDYFVRTAGVTVDLDGGSRDDGEAGEGDSAGSDVEGILGGDGADILTGNAGSGAIFGGEGDDRIADPGGADLIEAAGGDDQVDSVDGAVDTVECGDGDDSVRFDAGDELSRDCELPPPVAQLPIGIFRPSPPPRAAPTLPPGAVRANVVARIRARTVVARGLRVKLSCSRACQAVAELTPTPATVRALARRGVRVSGAIGSGSFGLGRSQSRSLYVRLSRAGVRALRRRPSGMYTLTIKVTDRVGHVTTVVRTVRFTATRRPR